MTVVNERRTPRAREGTRHGILRCVPLWAPCGTELHNRGMAAGHAVPLTLRKGIELGSRSFALPTLTVWGLLVVLYATQFV